MTKLDQLLNQNSLNLKALIVFRKADRSIRTMEHKTIKKNRLTTAQFAVLETLYSKGNLRIQDLIDKILATSGNMTVVIKNMVRDGLIFKTYNLSDKRSFLVGLTPKGRSKIEELLPQHIQNVTEIFERLDNQEKEQLINLLKKFKDSG